MTQLKSVARNAVTSSVPIGPTERASLLASIERDIEKYLEYADCVYLKAEAGSTVGYVLVKEYWNLAHLFVFPEHQGRGIGKSLLLSALNACKANNQEGFVRVNSSLNATGFYEKSGFVAYEPENPVPDFAVPMIYRFQ